VRPQFPTYGFIQKTLRKQEPWSDIPIIVLASAGPTPSRWTTGFVSKQASDANISILERPVRVPTIISVLRTAKRARNRQRQVQGLLLQEKESASKLRSARDELEQRVEQRTAAARQLSARLLQMQDEERRRIARELHDSAGQMVAALTMNIDQLKAVDGDTSEQARLLADSDAVLQNLNKELRTMSHLLHPPLLDEVGLSSALQWYVDGFAKRSGIATFLELEADFGRVNSDLEIAIFRLVQECLTNVHRHSGSLRAIVRLKRSDSAVLLEVQDEGHGIAPDKRSLVLGSGPVGVGLRGMRERVLQLGGTLHIDSGDGGTTIRAMFPIGKAAAVSPQEVVMKLRRPGNAWEIELFWRLRDHCQFRGGCRQILPIEL